GSTTSSRMSPPATVSPGPAGSSPAWTGFCMTASPIRPRLFWSGRAGLDGRWAPSPALEDSFSQRGLALPTDQAERLAAGRRKRRVDAVPEPLRPAVIAFDAARMRSQDRARRAGTRPRSEHTLETALAIMRDLADFFVNHRGKDDWALV